MPAGRCAIPLTALQLQTYGLACSSTWCTYLPLCLEGLHGLWCLTNVRLCHVVLRSSTEQSASWAASHRITCILWNPEGSVPCTQQQQKYLVNSTNHEDPYYAVFSSTSSVLIFLDNERKVNRFGPLGIRQRQLNVICTYNYCSTRFGHARWHKRHAELRLKVYHAPRSDVTGQLSLLATYKISGVKERRCCPASSLLSH